MSRASPPPASPLCSPLVGNHCRGIGNREQGTGNSKDRKTRLKGLSLLFPVPCSLLLRWITLEVGEQVADILVGERVQQLLRHQRHRRGTHLVDLVARDDRAFVLLVQQRHRRR